MHTIKLGIGNEHHVHKSCLRIWGETEGDELFNNKGNATLGPNVYCLSVRTKSLALRGRTAISDCEIKSKETIPFRMCAHIVPFPRTKV